ncbi:flagellum-specific ATP synthase FliI, partial [bacterium]|nr:flagellum-specific ATP synthase FliI [bacterium]
MSLLDLDRCARTIRAAERPLYRGEVDVVAGVLVEATGIPAAIGDLCEIDRGLMGPIQAEVIGFKGDRTL